MSPQNEIQNQYRAQQEKYLYYIIALSVAAIGFSIHITLGQKLMYSHILLGLSIICWAASCHFGINSILYAINHLGQNDLLFSASQGVFGSDPSTKMKARDIITARMDDLASKIHESGKWQLRLFYFGGIIFIIWHVLEMYLKAQPIML